MKAIIMANPGGAEVLQFTNIPTPVFEEDEILVKVKAISINPVDVKCRKGMALYGKLKEENPVILGWDISGVVEKVGAGVTMFKLGDEVFGMVNFPGHGRAYAEYVAGPAAHFAHKPNEISHEDAAAATLAALTAWQALLQQVNLKKGERVLIHAAAGGVGHFAVQIAKHVGAFVIGTASFKHKDYLKEIGLDEHVDYTVKPFEEQVKDVDVVLDAVGGDTSLRSLKVLKPGGRIVSILGGTNNEEVKKLAAEKNIKAVSYLVGSSGADMEALADLLKRGIIKAHVSSVFPFDKMGEAHEQLETGRTRGKIVVKV